MFGFRTPAKASETNPTQKTAEETIMPGSLDVRRSIGEWEAGKPEQKTPSPEARVSPKAGKKLPRAITSAGPSRDSARRVSSDVAKSPTKTLTYPSRTAEARACLNKAKLHLGNSRNLRTDIKSEVTQAMERMYQLVKEADSEKTSSGTVKPTEPAAGKTIESSIETGEIIRKLAEQQQLLAESNIKISELNENLKKHQEVLTSAFTPTYASVTSTSTSEPTKPRGTLHSVVVTSQNEKETGEEVLEKVRKIVDAKEGWIKIERVRKAKDRKIIMGLGSLEERNKLKEKLISNGTGLSVEEVKNRDPLAILKDVLSVNTDEDILRALRNQNPGVFHGLSDEERRITIKYRRRARNPHACHVVVTTSPAIWRRLTEKRFVHIDLQRIKVEDQTPLVQCTRCLGFGHGKRFCTESVDLCSHCGGPHMRTECPDFAAGIPPKCKNCSRAEIHENEHSSFSDNCPVRRRRDELARTTVAYC